MCFMIHVGHCQVRLDYYTITFLFFNISYHSSGYLQLHSYEIITHGNLPKKKFHKLSVLVATSIILISLLWDIQAWIFVGRWVQDSKGSRTRGLRFSASLLITNCSSGDFSHCCVQELQHWAHLRRGQWFTAHDPPHPFLFPCLSCFHS